MSKRKQYLQLFALNENATPEDIKKRYRSLAKKYHPDVNQEPYANETFLLLHEAYEYLISNKNSDFQLVENSKSDEINRMERIKRARERLKEARLQEQTKINNEYQKITKSKSWVVFRLFSYTSLVCAICFIIDFVAPKHVENHEITAYSTNYNGFFSDKICLIQTDKMNKVFVSSAIKQNLNIDNHLIIIKSWVFHHPISIVQRSLEMNNQYDVEFSFYNFSLVMYFIFLIPMIVYKKRNPSHGFFFLYRFAFYTVFPILLYFLVTEFRFLHLLTFGFF